MFKPYRALLWLLSLTLSASAYPRTIEKDSFEQHMLPCFACHGEQGRAAPDGYYPRIAGKPAGYLFEQLLNFRDGRRKYAMMAYIVDRKDEAYLHQMADYFAGLDLPYQQPTPVRRDPAVMALAEKLVRQGDTSRNLPACVACHGDRLTGRQPAIPGLLGLQRYYVEAQLGGWRQGTRHARAPDCMAEIAKKLRSEEVDAVVSWLASQPVPADAHASTESFKAPIRCGSLEPRS